MSGLFNLRVGGVEAEDIVCNGQAVEEVWVDGVQVFDAYDPEAVPAGTMSFARVDTTWPNNIGEARQTYRLTSTNGQAGATGYIYLATGAAEERFYWKNDDRSSSGSWTVDHLYNSTGRELGWSGYVSTSIALCYANGSQLFSISSSDRVGPNASGDDMYAGNRTIVSQSANYHGSKSARIDWNFKTRKVTISGSNNFATVTADFSNKWRPGMYVRLERSAGYSSGAGWYGYHSGDLEQTYDRYDTSSLSASAGN